MDSMYKLAKGPSLCRPALTPIQTRAPGSTGTDARVGAPSRRDNPGISERSPQNQNQFCPTVATRRSVVQRRQFLSGIGPSAWPDQPNQTKIQLGSGKANLSLDGLLHAQKKLVQGHAHAPTEVNGQSPVDAHIWK